MTLILVWFRGVLSQYKEIIQCVVFNIKPQAFPHGRYVTFGYIRKYNGETISSVQPFVPSTPNQTLLYASKVL